MTKPTTRQAVSPSNLVRESRQLLRDALNSDSWRHRSTLILKAEARLAKAEGVLTPRTT